MIDVFRVQLQIEEIYSILVYRFLKTKHFSLLLCIINIFKHLRLIKRNIINID